MNKSICFLTVALVGLFALTGAFAGSGQASQPMNEAGQPMNKEAQGMEKAIFAGGCFWCMEKPFEELDGVVSVTSGYTGGTTRDPTYENYAEGGHVEAVQVVYDPARVSYERLLDVYWHQVNPTDPDGQFVDRGHAYTTAIFYTDGSQKRLAEKSKADLDERGVYDKPIVTPILPAEPFFPAEDYHQDYYKKNPIRYHYYRSRSGRDDYLDRVWGKERKECGRAGARAEARPRCSTR